MTCGLFREKSDATPVKVKTNRWWINQKRIRIFSLLTRSVGEDWVACWVCHGACLKRGRLSRPETSRVSRGQEGRHRLRESSWKDLSRCSRPNPSKNNFLGIVYQKPDFVCILQQEVPIYPSFFFSRMYLSTFLHTRIEAHWQRIFNLDYHVFSFPSSENLNWLFGMHAIHRARIFGTSKYKTKQVQ